MSLSLVLPIEVIPSNKEFKTFILVGQRTTSDRENGSGQVVSIVFDSIPCVDTDVLAEQLECLEIVLPCGIELIGLLLCSSGGADIAGLRSALRSHPLESKLLIATYRDGQMTDCRLLKVNSPVPFTMLPGKPPFSTLSCSLRIPLVTMPLIVRSPDKITTDGVIIDLSGSTEIKGDDTLLAGKTYCATQLGSSAESADSVRICLHVCVALGYACGRDIYDVIRAFVPRLQPHPDGQITFLQSQRNLSLVFQWVYTPTAGEKTGLLKTQWDELRDIIEDGTGERVRRSQCVSYTSGPNLFCESATSKATAIQDDTTEEKNQKLTMGWKEMQNKEQEQKNLMRRCFPHTCALLSAVFVVFLWNWLYE